MGRNFWSNLAEDAFLPRGFGDAMGSVDYESARVIILFLGDVIRFSMGATSSECPFCPTQLHASHFFLCPNAPFRQELPNWHDFRQEFRNNHWRSFIFTLFMCLRLWDSRTNFFSATAKTRINDFFQANDRSGWYVVIALRGLFSIPYLSVCLSICSVMGLFTLQKHVTLRKYRTSKKPKPYQVQM